MIRSALCLLACFLGGFASVQAAKAQAEPPAKNDQPIRLGNFSVSLTVKDLAASRAFYEKLGFRAKSGTGGKDWLVMQNETSTIGLFHGMFEKNILTFNPGWDRSGAALSDYDDVRDIQTLLESRGLKMKVRADETSSGPASVVLDDPDGNQILLDQFVPRPKK